MAIDLKYEQPKTIDQVNENIKAISESAVRKQTVDIDTSSINNPTANPEIEALRKVVLNLINNLKGS